MQTSLPRPTVFIVAGPNGAGKSTRSKDLLPEHLKGISIFDGDPMYNEKKMELLPVYGAKESSVRAASLVSEHFNELVSRHIKERRSFAFEGHFTEGSNWQPIIAFRNAGYLVHMVYLGLDNPIQSLMRVAQRVSQGGHYVDQQTIQYNYFGNLDMLNLNFGLLHQLYLYSAGEVNLKLLASLNSGRVTQAIKLEQQPGWVRKELLKIEDAIRVWERTQKMFAAPKIAEVVDEKKGRKI